MWRIVFNLIAFLLPALLWPGGVAAIVNGSAEWNWAEYQRDVDGVSQADFSHFFQQYSLLYQDRGTFQGGRAGGWNIGLGYEWTGFSATLNDTDNDFSGGKILYQGDLKFTPAGLPLSLHAYSYDLALPTPAVTSRVFPNAIIAPDIYQGINDGQHVTTGLTLVAGGPSANLFGEYNEMLSALPRLLIDYREDYVRDLKGGDPQHYRFRDLAFVSLNRKNNWLHYKVFDYADFMDPANDYEEKVWLLGTVDHLNRRQWVNLTNWLAISVDGSLTRRISWGTAADDSEETYRLNLFSNAKRRDWAFSNFTTLSRVTTDAVGGGVEKNFDFPLFATGVLDPLNRWRAYFLGHRMENLSRADDASSTNGEDGVYAKLQLESKRYPGKILTPEAEVDWTRDSRRGDGQAARVGVELRSDNRLERARNWLAACSAAWFENSQTASTYTEMTARMAIDHQLSSAVKIGGSQELAVGFGDYSTNLTDHIQPTITETFETDDYQGPSRSVSGTSYRSTTNVYLELTPSGRWQNRFSIYYDLIHAGKDVHQFQLKHDASYSQPQWRAYSRTMLAEGDELNYSWQSDELPELDRYIGDPSVIFTNQAGISYWPNRFWDAKAEARTLWGKGERGDAWILAVEEAAAYHLYHNGGLARKKFSLNQNFEYQKLWSDDSLWYANMELSAIYYITNYLALESGVGVRHYGLTDQNEFEFEASAVATFRKLQAKVSYAYGRADESTFLPGVREQRWEVGLKKYF